MSYKRGIYNDDGEPIGIEIVTDEDERRWHEGDDYADDYEEE
ncbi:hypothetical protein UFOVP1304_49 [uncultured Caudovirales phage]|uniref:Uncharacterized protein n=1 Tax=uncultured Caudovirales phage TaxID=2100421 RepID=A0A6J5RY79_9CAUD|nr:hypothetical protein UFOVP1304_49 [uncultured Caudovirales phage]